jgi:tripartite ATP-independent transporter DctM subunit
MSELAAAASPRRARLPSRVLAAVALGNEVLVVAALAADLAVTFVNTIARYAFNAGIDWAADLSTICLAVMAFLGAAAYFRRGSGIAYTALIDLLQDRPRDALRAVGLWTVIGVCLVSLYAFPPFFRSQLGQTLPVLGVTNGVVGAWLGIGLVLMAVYAAEKLAGVDLRASALGFLIAAGIGACVLGLRLLYAGGGVGLDPLVPIAPVLLIAFVAGTPIALVLALGGVLYFLVTGLAPLVVVPAAFEAGIGSFVLLSIPFFMIAGALMDVTGMAARLIDMVEEWIGHWRGGLLLAEVFAMYIVSGMSGSKGADMATVGGIMKGPLRARGYPPSESVAVLAAAAAMGEVVPPSVALLILGSITTLSVGSLFVAGVVPAGLMAVSLAIGIILRSQAFGFPRGPAFDLRRALGSIPLALPALGVPVIVIGGIVGGVASPTEASSLAVVYGIAAAAFVYRSIRLEASWAGLRDAALLGGMVLFMVSAANLLSQAIVIDGLGRALAASFAALHDPLAFLFLTMAALIVIGFVLEGFPAILIAAPILLPVAERMAIDPLQYGILLVMAIGIGVFMPPVGIGFYVACAIGEAPAAATMRPCLIYCVFLVLGLIAAIVFPGVTLGLPHMFGLR